VLHDELPVGGKFLVPLDTLENRYVLNFEGKPLRPANLTGAALERLGGQADLSATADYALTQEWSRAIHHYPAKVDGFVYMSRHINDQKAVVLFDRARPSLALDQAGELVTFKGFAAAARSLGIAGT
jgi:hypothetical protein